MVIGFFLLILVIGSICNANKTTDESGFSTKYHDYQIKTLTIKTIKHYYPLLYPDTFLLKTCTISKSLNKEGFELWKVIGYFTAESKYGLEIKQDYLVSYRYYPSTDELKTFWVYIDGQTYYIEKTN